MPAYRVIGTSPARADAWEKVRGRPIYAGDLAVAGMLHGRIVRSPYASARIARLDTRASRRLPGDVARGFSEAAVVVEHTYRTPFVDHVYLETETGLGWIDAEGVLVLRVSTQVLEHYRDVAEILQLPHGRVRLEGTYLGGGFGGKEDVTVECLLGLLVWKTRRPVQLVFSREESFIGHGKRHPYVMRYRTGATRDGTLTAVEAELISDSGAYAALSPWVLLYSLVTATGPYRVPHVKVDATTVYTNNPVASAYRTFGSIQTCIGYEGQMDALAAALSMDPLDLRERNFLRKGDSIATGQVLESEPMLGETMRRAWQALGPVRPGGGPVRVARGLAASFTPYGRMCWTRDSASAWVGMELDGTAVVRCAAPDVGGGQTSSLCSITAEVLGVPVEQVTAVGRDSHFTPRAGTTTATRQLSMSGNAGLNAAREVRHHLLAAAAALLEAAPGDVELADGHAFVRGAPGRALTMASVVKGAIAQGRPVQALEKYDAPSAPTIDPLTGQGKAFNDYTFGTHAIEVEVDEETGRTSVSRFVACFDAGRVINRASAEGQLEGGAVQGLGYALMEEIALENGVSKNPHLVDYRIPSSLDVPPIETLLLESGDGLGPFGAKGLGEPAMTPSIAAVANAVSSAVGARVTQLPITAERVRAALRSPA